MKIVVAMDSFKGSLSSLEAGNAVREGILAAVEDAEVTVLPLADGGEGTVEALTAGMGGKECFAEVTGPLGSPVRAKYGIIREKSLAIMEMSQAAGISLVPSDQLNPMNTTTRGVGEMILSALDEGCRRFLIGIGGSATNDGGLGMLTALGAAFLDPNGAALEGFGRDLEKVSSIDCSRLDPRLASCEIRVACDVNNPLCGKNGCSAVYGPQKGATPEIVHEMDLALLHYARLVKDATGTDLSESPGAGAAGGLGFAFSSFLGGVLQPGTSIVLDAVGLEKEAAGADYLITGEGRLDFQTAMGKAPAAAAAIGKRAGATVLAFCGCAEDDAAECNLHGIDAFFPVLRAPVSLEEAMRPETATANIQATAEQVFRLILSVCS